MNDTLKKGDEDEELRIKKGVYCGSESALQATGVFPRVVLEEKGFDRFSMAMTMGISVAGVKTVTVRGFIEGCRRSRP
jgi:hypothetical protein